eukprot:COSAG04_NODE_8722_length_938_cov_2.799762_1_plen_79_part_01
MLRRLRGHLCGEHRPAPAATPASADENRVGASQHAPLAPRLLLPESAEPDTNPLLSAEEIASFKRDGYVLKRWAGLQYA